MNTRKIVLLGMLSGLFPFAIDFYLPANDTIAHSYGANSDTIALNISFVLLGVACGQFVGGPISDAYGRRRPALLALLVFMLSALAGLQSVSLTLFLISRGVMGIAGGILAVVVLGMISDRHGITGTARMISLTTVVSISMRLLAPVLGGYLVVTPGWFSLPIITAALAALCLYLLWSDKDETHVTAQKVPSGVREATKKFLRVLSSSKARSFIALELCCSIPLFAFVIGSPLVFLGSFGISSKEYGYAYAFATLVTLISVYCNNLLISRFGLAKVTAFTISAMFLSAIIPLAFGLIWRQDYRLQMAMYCTFLSPVMMTRMNATAAAIKSVPDLSGTATSIVSTLGFACGGICSLYFAWLYSLSNHMLTFIFLTFSVFACGIYLTGRRSGWLEESSFSPAPGGTEY